MAACCIGRPAAAYYEESHVTGDDVRVTVDPSGVARIEHFLAWRLVAGQPHGFDLAGTEPSAQPEPLASLEAEDGRLVPATLAVVPGHGLHLTILEPKSLRHGQQYRVHLSYGVDLAEAGELVREGGALHLLWKSPLPAEGFDDAKVTFILPTAVDAPGPLVGEGGMRDDGVASTLRRASDHDELELLRPHVGRSEEVLWAIQVSASAFDAAKGIAPAPPAPRRDVAVGAGSLAYALAALLAFAFAMAVVWKDRRFAALGRAQGTSPRGLVPLRVWERAALGGACLFVGLSLQLVDVPLGGSLGVALAMACAVLRAPEVGARVRGPGRWLVLRPDEAFARPKSSRVGIVVLVVVAPTLAFLVGRLLAPTHPEARTFLWLDLVVLVPLLATGVASQLPGQRARRGPWLARLFHRLQKAKNLRVSPWVRVPTGQVRPDEVRVLVVPRAPMPGLAAIEVGFASSDLGSSSEGGPEVLVRVQEASAASARLTSLALDIAPVPGRKPEERIFRVAPRFPTLNGTVALTLRLGRLLVDRRHADVAWERKERRVPPGARDEAPATEPIPVLG